MTPTQYDPIARAFHWIMAAMIIGLWCVGLILEDLPKGDLKGQIIGMHKMLGVIVMALTVLRLAWRATHPAPALPDTMTPVQVLAAKAAHAALYALMIALPFAGVLLSQSGGRAVLVFGTPLPTLIGKDEGLHEIFEGAHATMAWILAAILAVHVAAALYHHYKLGDDVMRKMLPGRT